MWISVILQVCTLCLLTLSSARCSCSGLASRYCASWRRKESVAGVRELKQEDYCWEMNQVTVAVMSCQEMLWCSYGDTFCRSYHTGAAAALFPKIICYPNHCYLLKHIISLGGQLSLELIWTFCPIAFDRWRQINSEVFFSPKWFICSSLVTRSS